MSEPNRQELKKRWRQRWEEAKVKLERAIVYVREIEREMKSTPRPDVFDAYRAALEAESSAHAEYTRVLRIYTDLVVHGKIPDEATDDPPQHRTHGAGAV